MYRANTGDVALTELGSSTVYWAMGASLTQPRAAQAPNGDTFMVVLDQWGSLYAKIFSAANHQWLTWRQSGASLLGSPGIAVDSNGVAWVVARSTYNALWLAPLTYSGFGSWTSLGGTVTSDPAIAISSSGIAHIIARDGAGNTGGVFMVRAQNGVSLGWTGLGGIIQGNPAVVAGLNGVVHIIARDPWNNPWVGVVSGTSITWGGASQPIDTDPSGIHVNNLVTVSAIRNSQVWSGTFSAITHTWSAWTSLAQPASSCSTASLQASLAIAARDLNSQLVWYQAGVGWAAYGSAFAGGALNSGPTGSSTVIGNYTLTTNVSPSVGGNITPNCPSGCSYAAGSQVQITATPATGYRFTGFTGALTGATNPQYLTMDAAKSVTANFAIVTELNATSLTQLRDCLANSQYSTCILAPKPDGSAYTVTGDDNKIVINRSVILRGGPGMNDTKIARDVAYTGDLIQIGSTNSVSGVVITSLTVCGSSNITPQWGAAPPSPVGCPRIETTCGARTEHKTRFPKEEGQPAQCVDVNIIRSALTQFPADPFSSPPASYAVEFDHVDLEDATGHALNLFPAAPNIVNDIYFHHGAINYSGVTGILMGVQGPDYRRKQCDSYTNPITGFANATDIYAPRNIRVEYNTFNENRTGVTGGVGRWIGYRHNTFTRSYIWPQAQGGTVPNTQIGDPNYSCGGTLEFDQCADQIQVVSNTFTGPGTAHGCTCALEMYGRNINVDTNTISSYQVQGIAAHSLAKADITNNTISFNGAADDGGITVTTVGAGGACETQTENEENPLDIYRESRDITIGGNTISGQDYGVNLADHPAHGTGAIRNLKIQTNYGSAFKAQYWQAPFVWANALNGYQGPTPTLGPSSPSPGVTPRLLPVDAESQTGSTRALCAFPAAARAKFTFSASDDSNGSANLPGLNPRIDYGNPGYAGAAQIDYIEGTFSITKAPSGTSQDCHFFYAADANLVYLDDGNGQWAPGSSTLGAGGHDLTSPNACIIHAATSSGTPLGQIQTGQYARSVTLDITFLGAAGKRYVYAYTRNKNGIVSYADPGNSVIWQHWGWWQKP